MRAQDFVQPGSPRVSKSACPITISNRCSASISRNATKPAALKPESKSRCAASWPIRNLSSASNRRRANVAPGEPYRISDTELASRLSFFLWSSIPDDELLNLAIQNKLHEPAVLERETRRMLADDRAACADQPTSPASGSIFGI